MESLNVFVKYGAQTIGVLLPYPCKYMDLVEVIMNELKLDRKKICVKIGYIADVEMAPISINSDSSLKFYMELKRKDSRLTAYALRVEIIEMLNDVPSDGGQITSHTSALHSCCDGDSPVAFTGMTTKKTKFSEFISSIEISPIEVDEEIDDGADMVVTHPDSVWIAENQVFRDKNVLKRSVALYAIRNNFQFKVKKSDVKEYVLMCEVSNCPWKFRASKIGQTDMFKLRYIRHEHTCSLDTIIREHRQANSVLVSDFIKHKYNSSRTIYTPADIMHDMAETHGLTLKYGKAWRAREHALEDVMGDPDDSFMNLPIFMDTLKNNNPGSVTGIEVDYDGHFKYAFMAIGACIQGWQYCKPVVVVDATFLTGRYGGSLFTDCTQDANNGIFVLAFGIGDSENNESWTWFLRKFKEAYGERDEMCIISDRHPSIEIAIQSVFPGVMHGFCAHHVLQNLRSSYGNSGKNIIKPFNAAARAYTKNEFDYQMNQRDQINDGIRKDLEKIGFHKWSRCHSHVNRFGCMTSNIVESVNAVVKSVKRCPVDYLCESLRHILQGWFHKNRSTAKGTFTRLATKQEKILRLNARRSLKLKVSPSNDFMYEVSDDRTKHIIDLARMMCTCNKFQVDGIPCEHALAVIGENGDQTYNYCSKYHTKDSYVKTYSGDIVPLGDREAWIGNRDAHSGHILPPKSRRPAGRPRNNRKRTRLECINPTRCGRCGEKGHNKRTCKQHCQCAT